MTPFVEGLFVNAGWTAGRSVPVPDIVPLDHPAAAALREFGGLRVGVSGPGEECGTSSLEFRVLQHDSGVVRWEQLLRTHLVGIAEVDGGYAEMYIAADGRCYGRSDIHDAFYFEGRTFMEAVERSLRGLRVRPMLRPDQDSVSVYGDVFLRGDPALYAY